MVWLSAQYVVRSMVNMVCGLWILLILFYIVYYSRQLGILLVKLANLMFNLYYSACFILFPRND